MNYKYQILQGVKEANQMDYDVIDPVQDNIFDKEKANVLFNYYKKIGDTASHHHFKQITQLVKVYLDEDGDIDYDKLSEVIREEEWSFVGMKGWKI